MLHCTPKCPKMTYAGRNIFESSQDKEQEEARSNMVTETDKNNITSMTMPHPHSTSLSTTL